MTCNWFIIGRIKLFMLYFETDVTQMFEKRLPSYDAFLFHVEHIVCYAVIVMT